MGLVVVIVVLGALLTIFGGRVKVPVLQKNAQGEIERVFRTNAQGEQEPVLKEVNKFLNALAKRHDNTIYNARCFQASRTSFSLAGVR